MATANHATNPDVRLADVKARLTALNCELLEDESNGDGHDDHYYVLDKNKGQIVAISMSLKETYAWVEYEEDRGGVAKSTRDARLTNLKERAASAGLELVCDDPDYSQPWEREYYLFDLAKRTIIARYRRLEDVGLERDIEERNEQRAAAAGSDDIVLPTELAPAAALLERLIAEAEAASTADVVAYFECYEDTFVAQKGDDTFAVTEANKGRRGLSHTYAQARLCQILERVEACGTNPLLDDSAGDSR